MARDILGNATGAPDLTLFVPDGEEGVADPTYRPVGSEYAELLHGDHTERSPVESLYDTDAVIRMNDLDPPAHVLLEGVLRCPENRLEGWVEVFKRSASRAGDPEHVRGMRRELAEALLGPLLTVDVLHHEDRAQALLGSIAEWRSAHARPRLPPIREGEDEVDAGNDRFASQRPCGWIVRGAERMALGGVGPPTPGLLRVS